MSALLWCAIDMFFLHGPAEDFEFILQDFAGRLLSMDKTVSDIQGNLCEDVAGVFLFSSKEDVPSRYAFRYTGYL